MPPKKPKKAKEEQKPIFDEQGKEVLGYVKGDKFVFTDPDLASLEFDFDSKPSKERGA